MLGYIGEELLLLLLYSHFNYKLGILFHIDVKIPHYIIISFIFNTFTPMHMVTLKLDSHYFQIVSHTNLLPVLWLDHPLHASKLLNIPKTLPSKEAK